MAAGSWVEAIMTQAVSENSQELGIARDFIRVKTDTMRQDLEVRKAETIEVVQQKLDKARESDNPSAAVIGAYEKLLARISA